MEPLATNKNNKIVNSVGIIERNSSPGFTAILKIPRRIASKMAVHILPTSIPGIKMMIRKVTTVDEIKFKVIFIILPPLIYLKQRISACNCSIVKKTI